MSMIRVKDVLFNEYDIHSVRKHDWDNSVISEKGAIIYGIIISYLRGNCHALNVGFDTIDERDKEFDLLCEKLKPHYIQDCPMPACDEVTKPVDENMLALLESRILRLFNLNDAQVKTERERIDVLGQTFSSLAEMIKNLNGNVTQCVQEIDKRIGALEEFAKTFQVSINKEPELAPIERLVSAEKD